MFSIKKDIELSVSETGLLTGREFVESMGRAEFELVVKRLLNDERRGKALRYYEGAVQATDLYEQLTAVSLLKETFESILPDASNTSFYKLQGKLADYHQRLSTIVGLLNSAKPVSGKLHFVWVGGGIGKIQGDYISVWKRMLKPHGYSLNLWYDSDALLAHETNRIIVESAKALGALSAPQGMEDTPEHLGNRYVERARALRQQMFEHIQRVTEAGGSADQARIDLLVSAYGQDEGALNALKVRNLQTFERLGQNGILLRDIRTQLTGQPLFDIYEREISFRGNLAAASDITRLQALNLEGGTYLDADLLPSLHQKIAGVDLSGFSPTQRIGVMQILLDHNPQILPNRGSHYADMRHLVPEQDKDALTDFAKKNESSLTSIFAPFNDVMASENGLRVGNKNGPEHPVKIPFNGLSNAMLSSHAGAATLAGVMEKIRKNYTFRDRVLEHARKDHVSLQDHLAFSRLIISEMEKEFGPISGWKHLPMLNSFSRAIAYYDADGIRFGAQSTIAMSGPSAVSNGLNDFVIDHGIAGARQQVSDRVDLFDGFNLATEEETHHSWKDNATTEDDWFELETKRIEDGFYKVHFKGDVNELLKGQALTFKKGWPVIEGRAVMLTSVLQALTDGLGEPFIRAMNEKLSGDLTFDGHWAVSFEDRQKILAQKIVEPPAAIGFEPIGNLNEMLARIGHGSLPLDQLSPAHRVLLGGLFGAQTLDDAGFASTWQQTRALAQATADQGFAQRYVAVEQALLTQSDPAFETGFATARARFAPSMESIPVLKALAFEKPLTLRQWGERVAQIKFQTEHELRLEVFASGALVLEDFVASGASTATLMPQGLLIRGDGDPGRHCFPLALVMAAAEENGPSAVAALRARLANANLEPDAEGAHRFLRTLKELRTVPMTSFGTVKGVLDLNRVMQILEARTATGSLMINTDNHSMLLTKEVSGESVSYRFYDPNFGIFGFDQTQELEGALKRFLGDPGQARLYGIAPEGDATFNVIELDGARIADQALPSGVRVTNLISHDPINSGATVTPWQHHAALRARSLSENARLGQGLVELEAHHWARQIQESTARLYRENSLGGEFVPLFESLREVSAGHYDISLVNLRSPESAIRVSSNDRTLTRIKSYLTETFQTLSVKPSLPGNVDPTDTGAVHTLNAGFLAQALLLSLKSHEGNSDTGGNRSLTTAVRIHGYLNYAQLAHGNLVDVAELIKVVNIALNDAPLVAKTTSSTVSKALGHIANEGVATVLQLATVGFDIYLLVSTKDDLQRAQYATQLAFDSTGLALSAAGVGAGLVGAGGAAVFLGGAGVILGGLAIGVGALVEGFNGTLARGRQIGDYLNRVNKAYRTGGHSIREGVFYPDPYAQVREIDLRRKRMTFGSQEILAATTFDLHPPNPDQDFSKAINIRQQLGHPEHAVIADVSAFQTIVLPIVAKTYLGYEYSALPGATSRHEHFETAERLEYDAQGNRQFWFTFYKFPSEYILQKLFPQALGTTIKVSLDEGQRSLFVPEMSQTSYGKLSYSIEGAGGQCAVSLDPGVRSVNLSSANFDTHMSWTLRASWLSKDDIVVEAGRLMLGSIEVNVAGTPDVFIQTQSDSLQVDWSRPGLNFTDLTIAPGTDPAVFHAHIRNLAQSHQLAGSYTTVENFLVPFEDPQLPQYTTAFYEHSSDRFIYARDLSPTLAAQARLGAVIGHQAYFFAASEALVWRADVATGQVNRFYRLMDPVPGSTLSVFQDLGQGLIRIVQKLTQRTGREVIVTYLLGHDELRLLAIAGHLTEYQEKLLRKNVLGAWSNFFWDYELRVDDLKLEPLSAVSVVDYKPGAFTSITRLIEGKRDENDTWVRGSDGLLIRFNFPDTQGRYGPINTQLLIPQTSSGNTFVFFDKDNFQLYRQKIDVTVADGKTEAAEPVESVYPIAVEVSDGRYVALRSNGFCFALDDQGQARLIGVNENWTRLGVTPLDPHWQRWTELEDIASGHNVSSFFVRGLRNTAGNGALSAWYVDGRLVVADMGRIVGTRLLGLTADQHWAWLLDSAGKIYRQRLLTVEQLPVAFNYFAELVSQDLLPAAQMAWPQWSFAQVQAYGTGLFGLTDDGVEVELRNDQPAKIVGVSGDWVLAAQGTLDLDGKRWTRALKALLARHAHESIVRVGGFTGYNWYVSETNTVVAGSDIELETQLLGSLYPTSALFYEVPTQLIYDAEGDIELTNSVARRDAEVLTLEVAGTLDDLMPLIPDNVTRLILGYGKDTVGYHVTARAWQRLECIVIDDSRSLETATSSGILVLETVMQDHWLVSLSAGQLVIIDPDKGHSLVFREAHDSFTRRPLNFKLQLSAGPLEVKLDELVLAMTDEGEGPFELGTLVGRLNEI